MRVMIVTWRRVVLERFIDRIINGICEILTRCRKRALENPFFYEDSNQDIDAVCKSVQTIVDTSVNELSIHFAGHSKFESDGEYMKLSSVFIERTEEFYESVTDLPYKTVGEFLNNDLQLAKRIFLPCTWVEIAKKNIELQLKVLQKHYVCLYSEFRIDDAEIEPQPLVDTAFGKMLFDCKPSFSAKKNIKVFIRYLLKSNLVEDIYKYNDLVAELEDISQEKLVEDEEIEFKNRELDFQIDGTREEKALFTMARDIDSEELMVIVANRAYS